MSGDCLGLVIVGVQQTPLDHVAVLRIFCDLETFLKLLLDKIKINISFNINMSRSVVSKCEVAYTDHGDKDDTGDKTVLDLRPGQRVVTRDGREGRVIKYCSTQSSWILEIQNKRQLLGWWWMMEVVILKRF